MAQSKPAATDDPYADAPPASPGADDVYESEQAATEKARTLFSVGAGFAQLGQWDKAYPILKKAFELKKHWQIVLWLAKSEVHLGKYKDAVTHAEMVLSDPELAVPETGPDRRAADRADAASIIVSCRAKLARLRIDLSPSGATLRIDGATLERNVVEVDPGPHTIEVTAEGGQTKQVVEARSGAETRVEIRVPVKPPSAVPIMAPPEPPAESPVRWALLAVGAAGSLGVLLGAAAEGGMAGAYGDAASRATGQTQASLLARGGESYQRAVLLGVVGGVLTASTVAGWALTRSPSASPSQGTGNKAPPATLSLAPLSGEGRIHGAFLVAGGSF